MGGRVLPCFGKSPTAGGIAMASEFVEVTSCASVESFEHVHADSIQQPSERDVDPLGGDSAVGVDSEFGAAGFSDFSDVIPDFDDSTNVVVEDSSEHGKLPSVPFVDILQAASQSLPVVSLKPIWEQGVWASIFGDSNGDVVEDFIDRSFVRPVSSVDVLSADIDSGVVKGKARRVAEDYFDVVKFKPSVSWQEQQEAGWQQAVKLWHSLICRWDLRCKLLSDFSFLRAPVDCCEMLSDIFRGRSCVTLKKRALAISRICDFIERELGCQFPCLESDYYTFLRSERNSGAPVSRLRGYNQALNFCLHVLGVDELRDVATSRRCIGAAKPDNPKDRVQASPLRVGELKTLHDILYQESSIWSSYFAGCALLCTYSRARWGDLMRAERLIVDRDNENVVQYIEVHVGKHKTMSSQQHKHKFLPMVAPAQGVDDRPWADRWLILRAKLQLESPPDFAIMPAPDQWGDATSRPLESHEAGAWLRKLLFGDHVQMKDRRVSSHSMKATVLSYAAKRGISVPDRLQLGYHTSQFQMSLVYSRDGAAASLIILASLLKEIREGRFRPDETRSGRIIEVDKAPAIDLTEVKQEQNDVPEVIDSSSSDESSSSDSDCDSEGQDMSRMPRYLRPPEAPPGCRLWQHSKSKILHLMEDHHQKIFVCSRAAGKFHINENMSVRYDTPICRICFKHGAE